MNAAVIVETRKIDLLEVVKRHLDYLPLWDLIIFCSDSEYAEKELGDKFHNKIIYYEFDGNEFNQIKYNQLLTSLYFWDLLKAYERVLLFQHDSGLLRGGIEYFLEYDYVGSPWQFQKHGGNGGLSLRSPKAMIQVIKSVKFNYHLHGNEDVYFCNHLKNIAPREICSKFACETIFKLGTIGYHAIDKYLSQKEVTLILNQYNHVAI